MVHGKKILPKIYTFIGCFLMYIYSFLVYLKNQKMPKSCFRKDFELTFFNDALEILFIQI